MPAARAAVSIALTIVTCPALAIAQTSPPPAEPTPPGAAAPSAPPPPPAGQQPPAGQPPPAVNQPPPPGYQQPPPGYYQQPPPGYQQPPPGYYQQPPPGYQQPPPGYYQQPPPGYYQQPPPGYYQQPPPGYYPPPAPAPPGPPPRTHGFLALPYLGVNADAGDTGASLGPGFMTGVLLGGRLNPAFSISGELRIDVLNFKNVPSGERWDGSEVEFGFSPLFHLPFALGEFVVGPKLGFFAGQSNQYDASGIPYASSRWNGLAAGFNTGLFFAVSRFMSLGGMLSFTIRDPGEVCITDTSIGLVESCSSGDFEAAKVLGFHAGALF